MHHVASPGRNSEAWLLVFLGKMLAFYANDQAVSAMLLQKAMGVLTGDVENASKWARNPGEPYPRRSAIL